jgi:hypothetical protein
MEFNSFCQIELYLGGRVLDSIFYILIGHGALVLPLRAGWTRVRLRSSTAVLSLLRLRQRAKSRCSPSTHEQRLQELAWSLSVREQRLQELSRCSAQVAQGKWARGIER